MVEANPAKNAALEAYPDAVISATANGVTVKVNDDGRTVEARDAEGKRLWAVDVVNEGGMPATGFPVVRHIEIKESGAVSVVVGRSLVVEIDIKTGKAAALGED